MTVKALSLLAGVLFAFVGGLLLVSTTQTVGVLLAIALLALGLGTFVCGVMSGPHGELAPMAAMATAGLTLTLFGAGLLGVGSTDGSTTYLAVGGVALVLGLLVLAAGLTGRTGRA